MEKWESIISDELLRLASERLAERQGEKYYREAIKLNNEGEEEPTAEQIKKFRGLYKRHFRQKGKLAVCIYKIAATAAMLLILFNVSAVSVPAVRDVVVGFLETATKVYNGVFTAERPESKYKIEFDSEYKITYLPDKYNITGEIKTRSERIVEYCSEQEEYIVFKQYRKDSKAETHIDSNEEFIKEPVIKNPATQITVNGKKAYLSNKNGKLNITWEEEGYYISISADKADESQLIKIAESVKRTK